jgi:hypothetical protein
MEAGCWIGPYPDCREAVLDALRVQPEHSVESLLSVLERRWLEDGLEGSEELAVYRDTVEAALEWAVDQIWEERA